MEEDNTNSRWFKIKRYIIGCVRVIRVTKKPTGQEFKTIVKVTGLGIALIGLVGFVITIIKQLLFP